MSDFATIEQAIEDIKNGKMLVVVDDEDRENEGDLIVAAGDPGQDLTVLHDLRLWWSSAEGRRGRAGFTCAYFPLRGTG